MLIARDPRLTEVIVGYANGLGQVEFRLGGSWSARARARVRQALALSIA